MPKDEFIHWIYRDADGQYHSACGLLNPRYGRYSREYLDYRPDRCPSCVVLASLSDVEYIDGGYDDGGDV